MMNRRFRNRVGVMALTAVLAGGAARGEGIVTVSVPFGFRVGARSFPAGNYQVIKNPGHMILRGMHDGAVALTRRMESQGRKPPCLVFAKSGDDYALTQVWTGEPRGDELVLPPGEYATRSSRSQATRVVVPAL
jgi:hypothetical protein